MDTIALVAAHMAGDPTPDPPSDDEELWVLIGRVEAVARAARELADEMKNALAARLDGAALRFGYTILVASPQRTDRLVDPDALIDWLGDDWATVIPVTASTRVRRRALEAVAEKRGVDPETVWDTFVETEWSEPRLQAMPVDRAPKWAQALSHGERRRR